MLNIFDNIINDDFDYIMSSLGQELFIDNKLVKAWIKNTKVNNGYHERVIITEHKFSRGSIIDYDGLRYLILSEPMDKKYGKYFKGNMRVTNELIYFKIDDKPYFFPCAIETEGMSLKTFNGGVLTLADGIQYPPSDTEEYPSRPLDPSIPRGSITIKYIDEKNNILDTEVMSDLEFKEYTINAKEIEGYTLKDTSSKVVTLTEYNPNQEVTFVYNELVINYTITITGTHEVEVGKTSQYTETVKSDGQAVTDKEVVWEVKRVDGTSSLSTINQNGLLSAGNSKENVIIIVKLLNAPSIYTEKQVEIFDNNDWDW